MNYVKINNALRKHIYKIIEPKVLNLCGTKISKYYYHYIISVIHTTTTYSGFTQHIYQHIL